jgi:L-ribulose-5-phosphate 3-epimerase
MAEVEPMEIGLVVWAEDNAAATISYLKSFGLRAMQLGVPPAVDCARALPEWKAELAKSDAIVTGAVCSYAGEDYSNMERVHESVGFTTPKYRTERAARTKEVAAFAHALGIGSVSCHIGFIPEDASTPLYEELVELTRDLCDACAGFKVNFDPANMILYGSGDPVQALGMLSEHVLSVHCKDGHSPAQAGSLGEECALGDGEVDFPAFLKQLKSFGYKGALTIEREEPNLEQKNADVRMAIERLKAWKAKSE